MRMHLPFVSLLVCLARTISASSQHLHHEGAKEVLNTREPLYSPSDLPPGNHRLVRRLFPHHHSHGHAHGQGHAFTKPTPSAPPLPEAPAPGGLARAYGMPKLKPSTWEKISQKATKKRKFATMKNGI